MTDIAQLKEPGWSVNYPSDLDSRFINEILDQTLRTNPNILALRFKYFLHLYRCELLNVSSRIKQSKNGFFVQPSSPLNNQYNINTLFR